MNSNKPTKQQLEHDYFELNLKILEIVNKYSPIGDNTIRRLFKTYGIPLKQKTEIVITKEMLLRDYSVDKLSLDEISKKYNQKSRVLVTKLLDEYSIPKRTHSESLQIAKEKEIVITKEQLYNDYNVLKLTQDEIAKKYGYADRQVIDRLFKKYNLVKRDRKESTKVRLDKKTNELNIPTKDELIELYSSHSISEIGKIYGLHRNRISKLLKEYDIDITYFKNNIDKELLNSEFEKYSIKELSIRYNTDTKSIKRRCKYLPTIEYDIPRLKSIIKLYDIFNQGFAKQIELDDINVYNSILRHTENHSVESEKITEKIYRLINSFSFDEVNKCRNCENRLKFYTMEMGYGNSKHSICLDCQTIIRGVSIPSQQLFWRLYELLRQPKNCHFAELNHEVRIIVTDEDKIKFSNHEKLNSNRYYVDFVLGDKIIEYDGEKFHQDDEKEDIKNRFLMSKGYKILHVKNLEYFKNKEQTIQKCLNFLNS
jgi:very-short-patch-repair endonuclease